MRWIYISPHFDDAVLSCGGLIWEQSHSGTPVEIWTVCAGNPPPGPLSDFAARMHADWKTGTAQETVALRRVEDTHAARLLGASIRHFSIPDCIYRMSSKRVPIYTETVFTTPSPFEGFLADDIANMLSHDLTPADTLVCPLAIGGHVDHQLVRVAAEKLRRPLWYYADVPYVINAPREIDMAVGTKRAKPCFVSPAGLRAWQEAILAYDSQLLGLFSSQNAMRQAIREYSKLNNGINLYREG